MQIEEHQFDQECEPCAADNERDEGYCADGVDDHVHELCAPGEQEISDTVKHRHTTNSLLATKAKKHADVDGEQRDDGGKRKKQRVA